MGGEVVGAKTGVEDKRQRTGLRALTESGCVEARHREGVVGVCPAEIQQRLLRRNISYRNSGLNARQVGEPRRRNGGFPRERIPPCRSGCYRINVRSVDVAVI